MHVGIAEFDDQQDFIPYIIGIFLIEPLWMVRFIITSSEEGRGLGCIHCIDREGTHYRSIVVAQIPSHFVKWDGSSLQFPFPTTPSIPIKGGSFRGEEWKFPDSCWLSVSRCYAGGQAFLIFLPSLSF